MANIYKHMANVYNHMAMTTSLPLVMWSHVLAMLS